ncbi:MAG: type II toxin-antitoxin system RelE/ParE family toxin [Isosphaeraceae bacterium]
MRDAELTDQARDDLREIWYSLSRGRDEKAADRLVLQIMEKCRMLARFPESGRLREELADGLRSFNVKP